MERRTVVAICSGVALVSAAGWGQSAFRERMMVADVARDYPHQVAEARRLHLKTSIDEIYEGVPEMGGGDATAIINLMIDNMGKRTERSLNTMTARMVDGRSPKEFLASANKVLELAREAGSKQTYAVWRTLPRPAEAVDYRHPLGLTTGLVILAMSAEQNALDGNTDQSVKDLQCLASLAKITYDCPDNNSYNACLNSLSLAFDATRRTAMNRQDDAAFLDRLRTEVIDKIQMPDPRPAIQCEALMTIQRSMQELDKKGSSATIFGVSQRAVELWDDQQFKQASQAKMLRTWVMLAQTIEDTWPRWSRIVPAVKTLAAAEFEHRKNETPQDSVARAFSPAFLGSLISAQTMEARRSLTGAWLSLLAAHARDHAWPLAIEVNYADPYDDKPLRYRQEGNGFVLYSSGIDGKDDQGDLAPRKGANSADVGFDCRRGVVRQIQGR
ncbi:MAG: hypothetical protein JSS65_04520 [Armatimonadetes bacterium]|nr:hypothetical protein [Armatimonadota bacterium]